MNGGGFKKGRSGMGGMDWQANREFGEKSTEVLVV